MSHMGRSKRTEAEINPDAVIAATESLSRLTIKTAHAELASPATMAGIFVAGIVVGLWPTKADRA